MMYFCKLLGKFVPYWEVVGWVEDHRADTVALIKTKKASTLGRQLRAEKLTPNCFDYGP